ncbi:MAG: hypothetical protein M1483_08755 [Actinobacteria bacterium]|nr:hypothetical protein [Actinomycetota bacterium]
MWWLSGRKQRSDSNVQDIDTKTIVGDGLNNVLSPTEQRELNKAFKQAYKEETRILEKKAEDVMYSLNAFNPHLTSITTQITPLENKPTTLILALANGSERTVIQLRCYDSEAVRLLQERLEQEEVIWIKGCNPGSFYLISFISPSQPTIPLLLSGKHLVQL